MKNLLLTAAVLLATTSAFAAPTGSAQLTITGTVAENNNVLITDNGVNMPIVAGGTVAAASVAESSNRLTGYKIQLSSAKSSKLGIGTSTSPTYFTTYTVAYDGGAPISLSTTPVTVKSVSTYVTADVSPLSVTVAPFAAAPAGTYSDTITVAISAP